MTLHGKQLIGGNVSAEGREEFFGIDPTSGKRLEPAFLDATPAEIDLAMALAREAHRECARLPAERRATLLEAIAAGIESFGEPLLLRAAAETGLPAARLFAERGRTCAQLRMFASLVREASWVEARIEHADPERQPTAKPDLRRMLSAVGPVVVFGASNFPLAYSVAGGDTASALAAGCPVVVKAHPNHPGTSEMVGDIIQRALAETDMPRGMFSLLHGKGFETGARLVEHPSTRAVGFTGSLRGGRAIFDLAARRPDPIPVFAEMGSINPVFVLASALADDDAVDSFAGAMQRSLLMGVGQFCTNPGVLVLERGAAADRLVEGLGELVAAAPAGTMLHAGIRFAFEEGLARLRQVDGVREVAAAMPTSGALAGPLAGAAEGDGRCTVHGAVMTTDAQTFLANPVLREEVFGPSTIVVLCDDEIEMRSIAAAIGGQLTASVFGTVDEFRDRAELLATLRDRVGRLVFNGFPTGVEVCGAMHHGGPYPATTDARSTSVGGAAMQRFARPICLQNMPADLLPPELRDANEMGLLRLVDGEWTRDPC